MFDMFAAFLFALMAFFLFTIRRWSISEHLTVLRDVGDVTSHHITSRTLTRLEHTISILGKIYAFRDGPARSVSFICFMASRFVYLRFSYVGCYVLISRRVLVFYEEENCWGLLRSNFVVAVKVYALRLVRFAFRNFNISVYFLLSLLPWFEIKMLIVVLLM